MVATKVVEQFLDFLRHERNRSQRTVEVYASDLAAFETFFCDLDNDISWESVDSDIIRDWMASMMDKGNTARSVSRRLSAVRSLYRFAVSRGLLSKNPALLVKAPKWTAPLPCYLREGQMDQLLDRMEWGDDFEGVRAKTIVMMLYHTGLRRAELCGLDNVDVDCAGGTVRVTGKGDKQRLVPFGEELATQLKRYVELREATVPFVCDAFFVDDKGGRVSDNYIYKEVKNRLSQVSSLPKNSPHVLRHTFASALLNHGAGLESVRLLLGHSSINTTMVYTHTTFDQLRQVYNVAHPRQVGGKQ